MSLGGSLLVCGSAILELTGSISSLLVSFCSFCVAGCFIYVDLFLLLSVTCCVGDTDLHNVVK